MEELRDQLAVAAPPCPDWFEPKMRPYPKIPKEWHTKLPDEAMDFLIDLRATLQKDCDGELPDYLIPSSISGDVLVAVKKRMRFTMDSESWLKEKKRESLFQWPWHYADMVIERRYK